MVDDAEVQAKTKQLIKKLAPIISAEDDYRVAAITAAGLLYAVCDLIDKNLAEAAQHFGQMVHDVVMNGKSVVAIIEDATGADEIH